MRKNASKSTASECKLKDKLPVECLGEKDEEQCLPKNMTETKNVKKLSLCFFEDPNGLRKIS